MPEPRDRTWTETGEYEEMYSPEEVYDLVRQAPRQVATTPDITSVLGCTRSTARTKLRELMFEGKIENRKPTERITLWFPTEESNEGTESTDGSGEEDPDAVLKRLSTELGEAITVGDVVYENGDKHPAEQLDADAE